MTFIDKYVDQTPFTLKNLNFKTTFQKVIPLFIYFSFFILFGRLFPSSFLTQTHSSLASLLNGPNGSFINTKILHISKFNFPIRLDLYFESKPTLLDSLYIFIYKKKELVQEYQTKTLPALYPENSSFTSCAFIVLYPLGDSLDYKAKIYNFHEMKITVKWSLSNIQVSFLEMLFRFTFGLMTLVLILYRFFIFHENLFFNFIIFGSDFFVFFVLFFCSSKFFFYFKRFFMYSCLILFIFSSYGCHNSK